MKITATKGLLSVFLLSGLLFSSFIERAVLIPVSPATSSFLEVLPGRDDNMALGNPSGAIAIPANPNNYLLVRDQYVLSYNNSRGTANWVSWHLSSAWKGPAKRSTSFRSDKTLPASFYRVKNSDYNRSGFDRGHMCPSDDRDATEADNAATFLMCNIVPQAPVNNQECWKGLEDFCRELVAAGNELYIISGTYGSGGVGKKGIEMQSIASGKITVPARVWKVVLIIPLGTNDLQRIGPETRVIAVDMPNTQDVKGHHWEDYTCTVDAIEAKTGYNLFSNLPESVQDKIERRID